ncbi:MAG: 30S ribosomal protein S15 [Candidatus Hadarchaeota archaeon]
MRCHMEAEPQKQLAGITPSEVEELVVKMGKEGMPPSKIGATLRDQYAVPSVKKLTGKNITQILGSYGIKQSLPEDLASLVAHAVKMYGHMGKHPKDFTMRRAVEITEAKINSLARHYKEAGVLPSDWKYDRERAALLIRR